MMTISPEDASQNKRTILRGYMTGRVIWNLAGGWSALLCGTSIYVGKPWYVPLLLFFCAMFFMPRAGKDTM
jgi:hypothetical protein